MDFLLENWMLILVALGSGTMLAWPRLQGGGSAGLTPAAAVQLINRERAVVIDVCEAEEYERAHVAGARSIPLRQLEAELPRAVKNKERPLVLVCSSGARSGRAVSIARKLGYENALSLTGGLKSWRNADLPVEGA